MWVQIYLAVFFVPYYFSDIVLTLCDPFCLPFTCYYFQPQNILCQTESVILILLISGLLNVSCN